MILIIIAAVLFLVIQIVLVVVLQNRKKKRDNETIETLRKYVKREALDLSIKNPISNDEAINYEFQKSFLRIEFIDAKPWLAYLFNLDQEITFGRSRENRIAVRDDRMSRTHCKIYTRDGFLWIEDCGSLNGTILKKGFKKIRLEPLNPITLNSGDMITIGKCRMKVKIFYGYQAAI